MHRCVAVALALGVSACSVIRSSDDFRIDGGASGDAAMDAAMDARVDTGSPPDASDCSSGFERCGAECVAAGSCDAFVEVSSGRTHVCARRRSGAIDCWGQNEHYEISRALFPLPAESPTRLLDAGGDEVGAISVTVGETHTCFVAMSKRLFCQGSNAFDQIGDASGENAFSPTEVTGSVDFGSAEFVAVYSHHRHSCALDTLGGVWCWGDNAMLQAGPMGRADRARKIDLGGAATSIALSNRATCALTGGEVRCWGDNSRGQLGRSTSGPTSTPAPVVGPDGAGMLTNVARIVANRDTHCALQEGGDLYCWGDNSYDAIPDARNIVPNPTLVASNVSEVFMHALGLCWVDSMGAAYCRGRREEAQFGDGMPTSDRATSDTRAMELDGMSDVSGHTDGACGFKAGELYCWGLSRFGTVPRASLVEERPAPGLEMDGSEVTGMHGISMGQSGACGVRAGQAFCWGEGGSGAQGNGTNITSGSPAAVSGLTSVIAVARGGVSVCAIDEGTGTNRLFCWGSNRRGAMGVALTTNGSASPMPVDGVPEPTAISLGHDHGCAISGGAPPTSGGTVYCWGDNGFGEAGQLTTSAVVPPTVVQMSGVDIDDAVAIGAGEDFSCAIRPGGQVVCWGNNAHGQLGTGTTVASLATDSGVSDGVSLDLGATHACAVNSAGHAMCWGDNEFGQVGAGDAPNDVLTPVRAATGSSAVVSVAAGDGFSCSADVDGNVRCWGAGFWHQLGNGRTETLGSPALVEGLTSVVHVTNGSLRGDSTCAERTDGSFSCWGLNEAGRLATDPNIYFTPIQVAR